MSWNYYVGILQQSRTLIPMSHNLFGTGSDYGHGANVQSKWDQLGSGNAIYRLLQHNTKHPACYVQARGFMLHPLALMYCQLPCNKIENLHNAHKVSSYRKSTFKLITITNETVEADKFFFPKLCHKYMYNLCTKYLLCIRYESPTLMIIQILVLLNGLVDQRPPFQRNIFLPFPILKKESQRARPKCRYLSTTLQETVI
jgi:hypothetical protein